jgi:saccharopine dehydrogenase-like NADP-dependent oxidoreductase
MKNVLIFGFGNIAHAIIASANSSEFNFYVYSESNKECSKAHKILNFVDGVIISQGHTQNYSSIEKIEKMIGKSSKIFSLQRVPYIARCTETYKLVTSYKKDQIFTACNFDRAECLSILDSLFNIKINFLDDVNNVNLLCTRQKKITH